MHRDHPVRKLKNSLKSFLPGNYEEALVSKQRKFSQSPLLFTSNQQKANNSMLAHVGLKSVLCTAPMELRSFDGNVRDKTTDTQVRMVN